VLIKVPEKWIRDFDLAKSIKDAAINYLRQSTHVMSVKFYTPVTIFTSVATRRMHATLEVSNPKFADRNWDMFGEDMRAVGGRPRWWMGFMGGLKLPDEN
jgi:hypothetical protein